MKHNVQVLGLMLDLVSSNLKDVSEEHAAFVHRAMKAAKRAIADTNKAERLMLEAKMAKEVERQPYNLGERARLV